MLPDEHIIARLNDKAHIGQEPTAHQLHIVLDILEVHVHVYTQRDHTTNGTSIHTTESMVKFGSTCIP